MLGRVSFQAGWYDDPQDPTQQRYWDGSTWTDQRRAQQGPPPYQGQFGQQPGQTGQPGQPSQTAQHGQVYGGAQPGPVQYGQPAPGQYGQPTPGQHGAGQYGAGQYGGQPGQGYPPYPQQGQGYPQQGYGYPGQGRHMTPDGQLLAGWWRRVWARILDSIIVGLVGLPFTGYFYYKYFQVIWNNTSDLADRAARGEQPPSTFTIPAEAYKWVIPALLIGIVVSFVYEYLFLTKKGATLGKMALGIKVRLRDVPGNPTGSAVAKRIGFVVGISVLGVIPLVGTLVGLVALLDDLWPLWDDKKQALHDKIAATNVVLA
jgi:uncharacterized RDD family membrane protein YckC